MIKIAGVPSDVLDLNRSNVRALDAAALLSSPSLEKTTTTTTTLGTRGGITFHQIADVISRYGGYSMAYSLQRARRFFQLHHTDPSNFEDDNCSNGGGVILPVIPCCVMHSSNGHCVANCARLFFTVFRTIVPVYAAMNFVPLVVLKAADFFKRWALCYVFVWRGWGHVYRYQNIKTLNDTMLNI
jgi:hypothetical protein